MANGGLGAKKAVIWANYGSHPLLLSPLPAYYFGQIMAAHPHHVILVDLPSLVIAPRNQPQVVIEQDFNGNIALIVQILQKQLDC